MHQSDFIWYFGCTGVAFLVDLACLLGIVFVDFDSSGDDLAPYTFALGMVSILLMLELMIFLWIPFALHRVPNEHWHKLRAKLVAAVPICGCCLPASTADLDPGPLIGARKLVWDESVECHEDIGCSEYGDAIVNQTR